MLTDHKEWEAVEARDRAMDGVFLYAVISTGIYCRPSCPSKRPRRENVVFFRAREAAEQAGFRPCKRCKPDSVKAIPTGN
jgi:AraC family transcriptional regulator of adaptative response/methylated-DNA-[protein]-cysteine methyltransferase